MNVAVIGGGPGGLYAALLLRQVAPDSAVTVYEQRPAGRTFGWGVVFSGRTLEILREADDHSAAAIEQSVARWDNVDILHRDQHISIYGNRFHAISRLELLRILQDRCRQTGVTLRFEHRLSPDEAADADLVVGADGVGSSVRESLARAFRPELADGANPYIWYGTPHLFHGLTLIFRQSEHGAFAAHCYKFSADRSTFIVECDPQTFERAGLDRSTEPATRAYLSSVFADDLAGAPLLSNDSSWIRFRLVKNERWQDGQTVLLGDAAHTAHFSIGSGTKLALEDAIALARAFDGATDVPTALATYEAARKPVVDAYQAVARASRLWFERVPDLIDKAPIDLAMSAMLRSGRIDKEGLRQRDPDFVDRYDRWQQSVDR